MRAHTITGGGGVKLHVVETGNRRGRPVLFVHGFSQCSLVWTRQLASDLAGELHLVALDNRGHGLSEKPRDAYGDPQLWADDLQAVIDALALDRPVLVGWSFGGLILCDYLRCRGEAAIRGTSFVGAATKLGEESLALTGADFLPIVPGFFSSDAEESIGALRTLVRMLVHAEPTPEDFYTWLGFNVVVPSYVRQAMVTREVSNDDVLSRLERPVLVTHGERDGLVLPEAARQHAALIPDARLSLYPEVGHSPFWEDPERFNRELREFVRGLPASP